MQKMTSIIAASAIIAVSAGSAFACPWASAKYDSASDQKMSVAQAPAQDVQTEAMSTFDPKIVTPEEKAE